MAQHDRSLPITIDHNPECGISRNTLAMIEAAGYVPNVVEYRKIGWTRPLRDELCAAMAPNPRDVMRKKGTPAVELGPLDASATDDAIVDAMVAHPILVNRPIVVTPKGTALCRPSESVVLLLGRAPDHITKEDGDVVRLEVLDAHKNVQVGGLSRVSPLSH